MESFAKMEEKDGMKNNFSECDSEDPIHLIEEMNDAKLITLAVKRLESHAQKGFISSDDIYKHLNIDKNDLSDYDKIEFE